MAFKQVDMKSTEIQGIPSPQTVNFQAAISKFHFFPHLMTKLIS